MKKMITFLIVASISVSFNIPQKKATPAHEEVKKESLTMLMFKHQTAR